jgi:hypothetical protein
MAETGQQQACADSNLITESKVLLAIPRKQSGSAVANSCHGNGQPAIHPLNGHLVSEEHTNDVDEDSIPVMGGNHGDGGHVVNGDSSSSSSSDDEDDDEGEEESSESSSEEGELSEEAQLKEAGVDIDLQALGTPSEGGVAPLHLLSEVSP